MPFTEKAIKCRVHLFVYTANLKCPSFLRKKTGESDLVKVVTSRNDQETYVKCSWQTDVRITKHEKSREFSMTAARATIDDVKQLMSLNMSRKNTIVLLNKT